MELTPKNKKIIDSKSYEELLSGWRFTVSGDLWFQGATGDYWSTRMAEFREKGVDHVGASKAIGF